MDIKLEKPLIVLDIEATGDQINKDRIVEIGMIKTNPDGSEDIYDQRINPQIPIPLNISEIHSIYDLDIKDSPSFKEVANEIKIFIGDSDLCGFNSNKFDIPILEEEFIRAGLKSDFEYKKFVDVQNIFHKMEKRTLAWVSKFRCPSKALNPVCVGALPLAKSGVLENKNGTTYNKIEYKETLKNYGVIISNKQIVVDDGLITSNGPSTAVEVAFTLLEKLTSTENTVKVKKLMGF